MSSAIVTDASGFLLAASRASTCWISLMAPKVAVQPQESWIVHQRPEMALVSAEMWEAVNAKIAARGDRCRAARARKASYPLSGLVKCGECGATMVGTRASGIERYYCSSFYKAKKCACSSVHQDNLLAVLKDNIRENCFCGGDIKALINKGMKGLPGTQAQDRRLLLRQYETTKQQYDRATQNLLLADPENVRALNNAMTTLRKKLESLKNDLAEVPKPVDQKQLAERVMAEAPRLLDNLMSKHPERLKAVLSRLVEKVELRFGDGHWGKRRIRVITGCDAYLRLPFSFTTENRGDWICPVVKVSGSRDAVRRLNGRSEPRLG
ncbi:MAG TPA: zinc ribbon domain-containing protein [Planctomycetota bacterium]